jgi:D-arabinose 1-dehydrogenase-like Zn-dependent alcohol dehydrogenase
VTVARVAPTTPGASTKTNKADERMLRGDVKYRFVIDMASL